MLPEMWKLESIDEIFIDNSFYISTIVFRMYVDLCNFLMNTNKLRTLISGRTERFMMREILEGGSQLNDVLQSSLSQMNFTEFTGFVEYVLKILKYLNYTFSCVRN